ncbi:MAG: site-2 protease family protein [Chloroflexi bacterium]|nr:site-2 protease family protein [Chloroflexota bacterium]
MPSSLKLFTIRGIPVDINVTWLIAFAIITWTFSTSAFPSFFEFWSTQQYWLAGTVATVLLFTSVLAHELGHSFVALSQGLRVRGITLLLFGGVSRIEGNATRPRNEFFIAAAGPTVSLLIGVILLTWWTLFHPVNQFEVPPLHGVIFFTGWMNLVVGVFNLLPGYPLDGGRVLRSIVWGLTGDTNLATKVAFGVGRVVFYLLIAWGGWQIVDGDVVGGVWIALIGWFLLNGARSERAAQESSAPPVQDHLGFSVGLAARPMPQMIEESTTISQVHTSGVLVDQPESIPVPRKSVLIGFVTPQELDDVLPEHRADVVVGQVVNPDSLRIISAYEAAREALRVMDSYRVSQLVVMDTGFVMGIVTRRDILDKMMDLGSSANRADPTDV